MNYCSISKMLHTVDYEIVLRLTAAASHLMRLYSSFVRLLVPIKGLQM